MLLKLLIIVIWCLSALLWFYRKHKAQCKYKLPPKAVGTLPIIGIAHKLFTRDTKKLWKIIAELMYDVMNKGGICYTYVGPYLFYGITDPDDCMTVANSCLEKNFIYSFAKNWLGEGLATITTNLTVYKRHRKIINKAFNQKLLDGFIDVFNTQSRYLADDVSPEVSKTFNPTVFLRRRSMATICLTFMGVDEDAERSDNISEKYLEAAEKVFSIYNQRLQRLWLYSETVYNWSTLKKEEDKYTRVLVETSNRIIKKRCLLKNKNKLSTNNNKIADEKSRAFLDTFLELPAEDSFSEQEIGDEVNTMILAGFHTVASTLVFALMEIGARLDVQEKIYFELREVFGDTERDVTKKDLSKLVYLEAVCHETIRLYPVGATLARYVSEDVKLKNYTLPAGSSCILFTYCLHRDPKLWGSDAEEFSPERWLDPGRMPKNPNAFAGFSIGKRNCVGRNYAMMSMKITLAHILRRYQVSANLANLHLQYDVMLQPAAGCEITINKRTDKFDSMGDEWR